jgi:hypothetical protein
MNNGATGGGAPSLSMTRARVVGALKSRRRPSRTRNNSKPARTMNATSSQVGMPVDRFATIGRGP